MSLQTRTGVYALLVVGEAVVIFVLAALLLLRESGGSDLGDVGDLGERGSAPAANSGAHAAYRELEDDPDIRQPFATDASDRRTHDSAPGRVRMQAEERYTPEDPVGLVLYGTVFDPGGKPLERARLRLTSLESGRGLNATFYPNSGYAVAGLEPGPWRISVTATGYHPISRTINLAPSPVRLRLDLHVQSATTVGVAVRTPEGRRLNQELIRKGIKSVSLVVQAFAGHPGARFPAGLAGLGTSYNDRSRWTWRSKQPGADGSLEILVAPPCFVALLVGEVVLDCKPFAGREKLVTLTASLEELQAALGSILVNVSSSDGSALTGVRVYTDNAVSRKPTSAGGSTYRLAHVKPGWHRLIVTAKGRGNVHRRVRVESGKELEVDVVLAAEARVEGRVVGPDGPVGDVSIRMYPLDPRAPATQRFRASTDGQGRFEIDRLSPGDYQMVAHHRPEQLYGQATVSVRPGRNFLSALGVTGAGKLVVEASALTPGEWHYIRIHDRRGRVLYRRAFDRRGTSLALPPGRHAYKIVDRNEQLVRTGTFVIGNEPVVLSVH